MASLSNSTSTRVEEALNSLRYKPLKSTSIERIRLSVQADELVSDEKSQPLQFGKGVEYILQNISLPIEKHDLIAGRIAEEVLMPEEELEFLSYIERYPSERKMRPFIANFMGVYGLSEMGGVRPLWMHDFGHTSFDWKMILEYGLSGLKEFAEERYEVFKKEGDQEKCDFVLGAIHFYQAYITFASRYADACRKIGLVDLAETCDYISANKPESFRQALQLIWLISVVFCGVLTANPTLSMGRMDQYLYPYYKRDVETGVMTREQIGDLIEDFYCKNNLMMGRGEHQLSNSNSLDVSETVTGWNRNLNYDAPQYLLLGGMNLEDKSATNELTELFIDRITPRFENPLFVFRYTSDTDSVIWNKVMEKACQNSSILLYNDHDVVSALMAGGATHEEAVEHIFFGCNRNTLLNCNYNKITNFNPLKSVVNVVNSSVDYNLTCMDDIFKHLEKSLADQVRPEIQCIIDQRERNGGHWENALLAVDCFVDGPVEKGINSRYKGIDRECVLISTAYIGSTINALYAIQKLVFEGDVQMSILQNALSTNFAGYAKLRKRMLDLEKYGQDVEEIDALGRKLIDLAFNTVMSVIKELGVSDTFVLAHSLETDTDYWIRAFDIGATPDGRLAGQPTSQNATPVEGTAINGLTSMLNSVARITQERVASGANNITISKSMVRDEHGKQMLAQLLKVFFEKGGLQAQLSVADVDEMKDAQKNPDQHRDLMVRITGYSASFVDMTEDAQESVIRREDYFN